MTGGGFIETQVIQPDLSAPDRFPASDIADLIASGYAGAMLAKLLHAHFPAAPRGDVYLAIGLAVAILQADLTAAQMETRLLRQHGARLPGGAE